MNREEVQSRPLSNPFATTYLAPGRLCWLDSEIQLENLASRFREVKGRAAIVGPHGVGKSTLLTHLVPLLQNDKGRVLHCQLRSQQRGKVNLGEKLDERISLVVVDGYEQLSWWRRIRLLSETAIKGKELLVTSHRTTFLTTLVQLRPNEQVLEKVIRTLIDNAKVNSPEFAELYEAFWRSRCGREGISDALAQHSGSLREVLMHWYDSFETFSTEHT